MLYDYTKPVQPKRTGYIQPMSMALAGTGRGTGNPGIRKTHPPVPGTANINRDVVRVTGTLGNLQRMYGPNASFTFFMFFGKTEIFEGWVKRSGTYDNL